jgi:hypothetical protein
MEKKKWEFKIVLLSTPLDLDYRKLVKLFASVFGEEDDNDENFVLG